MVVSLRYIKIFEKYRFLKYYNHKMLGVTYNSFILIIIVSLKNQSIVTTTNHNINKNL